MTQNNKDALVPLLQTSSLAELRAAAQIRLTLPQAQEVARHAKKIASNARPLRLGILHTYTSDLLDPWLEAEAALHGLDLATYHGPYGVTLQEAREDSELVGHAPDVTLLMLRYEDLHPELSRPLSGLGATEQESMRREALGRLTLIVDALRAHKIGHLLLTLLPRTSAPGLGLFDAQSERSEAQWLNALKSDIAAYIRGKVHAAMFLDLDQVLIEIGRRSFFDHRLWHSARFPFTSEAAREVARLVMAVGTVLKYPRAKVLALDADNTLWGGIIGEDGMNGIALGPDYPGSAYVAFQRRILDYQQRGFILALCSKNNPEDVRQVFREHPHQILREEHFAAQRVNWMPKADNLIALAEELNLGLDSFVFVDDSDHECAAVRHRLPQVEVIQTPAKPLLVPQCLERVARLEILSLTAEDLAKTELYAQEKRRKEFMSQEGTDGYLESLGMKMQVSLDNAGHLARLAQLTQKTNQFNLTTRRYSEKQVQEFMASREWLVADFSLADVFGDSGIVGLAIARLRGREEAEIDTFLMSCRVIGRQAESAFLNVLLSELATRGILKVRASYLETGKNSLVNRFLPDHEFDHVSGESYVRDLSSRPPKHASDYPISVTIAPAQQSTDPNKESR